MKVRSFCSRNCRFQRRPLSLSPKGFFLPVCARAEGASASPPWVSQCLLPRDLSTHRRSETRRMRATWPCSAREVHAVIYHTGNNRNWQNTCFARAPQNQPEDRDGCTEGAEGREREVAKEEIGVAWWSGSRYIIQRGGRG